MAATRLNKIYWGMRGRCENVRCNVYSYYGARGISVCNEWREWPTFRDWALSHGYRDDLQLDRIDNSLGYSPDNTRWTDRVTQQNNTSWNRWYSLGTEKKTLTQWSRDPRASVGYKTIHNRLRAGWPFNKALTQPKRG